MSRRARRNRNHSRSPARSSATARPAFTPPSPPEPEPPLLDQIAAGELDDLVAIAEAVRARHGLLHTISSQKALATLNVGDCVRINHHASPRYLHGVQGVVVELGEYTAVVRVHPPIGRFKSGEIRCPPLVLDRLIPAA